MTDQEFIVLDELYFVQSFAEVKEATGLNAAVVKQVLEDLLEKGWIRCMSSRQDDEPGEMINFQEGYEHYFYLATKTGLKIHNSR